MRTAFVEEAAVIAVIKRARQLLQHGWCQNDMAKDIDGEPCEVLDPQAAQFCMLGGLSRAAYEQCNGNQARYECLYWFAREVVVESLPKGADSVGFYNDQPGRRRATVLRRLDIAAGGK